MRACFSVCRSVCRSVCLRFSVVSITYEHRLLARWPPISPVQALELLDAQFSDAAVRKYAVRRLKTLEDHEVEDYLLQLTQVRVSLNNNINTTYRQLIATL